MLESSWYLAYFYTMDFKQYTNTSDNAGARRLGKPSPAQNSAMGNVISNKAGNRY